ncbi:hypothetical protein [Streptomyces sp. 6N223]|uniref:hypothetical protein n=1 Tax=Streptomyces sp. 6N223 TaxID=3457412 RepID=UPI003FCF849D
MPEQQTATPAGGQQGTQDSATIRRLREEVRRVNEINKKNRESKGSKTSGGRS